MKKLLSLLITLSTLLSSVVSVYADLEITVNLNGAKITFDQPPIIQNDRTLVPMRAIFEALGCLVFWDEEDRSVEAWQGGVYIMTLWVNDYNMKLGNSDYITLDVPPTIINDRTLVPLRAISESMGAEVEWNGATHTVDISYNRTSYYPTAECNHINTIEATVKGIENFENTGSSTTHKVIEYAEIVCEDCGDTIDTKEKERTEAHNFEDNVCADCGYKKKISCSHANTHDVISIDAREYENTGSSSTHKVIDEVEVYCDDCDEQTDTKYKKSDKPHNFEGNVCVDCGYEQDNNIFSQSASTQSIELKNLIPQNQYSDANTSGTEVYRDNGIRLYIDQTNTRNNNLSVGDSTKTCVEYNVGDFNRLSGIVTGDYRHSVLKIYGDDNLVYETIRMKDNSNISMDIDISQYSILRFEAIGTVTQGQSHTSVTIKDATLWY